MRTYLLLLVLTFFSVGMLSSGCGGEGTIPPTVSSPTPVPAMPTLQAKPRRAEMTTPSPTNAFIPSHAEEVTASPKVIGTPTPTLPETLLPPATQPTPYVVQFPLGTTQMTVGCDSMLRIGPHETQEYSLRLLRGRWVRIGVFASSLEPKVAAQILWPDGKQKAMENLEWEGEITETGEYRVKVSNEGDKAVDYNLNIEAPAPITLSANGFTEVRGRVRGSCGEGLYTLMLSEGEASLNLAVQTLSGEGRLVLEVEGLRDHVPYLRAVMGLSAFKLQGLPAQRYLIKVVPWEIENGGSVSPDETWEFVLKVSR